MIGKKRLWIAVALVALIASVFWSQSRVPALNAKAEMGGELQLEDPLSFDVVLPVERADPLAQKVAYTTVNWAYTNWKGMTFGLLIGGALMGLFGLLARRSYKNPIINSALGIVIGAPLGVCVNCATPIAQGIYSAGARLETALAMLLSSPTMNVIVLTMLIAMFPPYFVVIKLGLTVGFLLIGIPLVARRFAGEANLTVGDEACPIDLHAHEDDHGESWLRAAGWVARNFLENLWWIVRKTLPLMVLAGFLGSLAIHVLPWDVVVNLFEDHGGSVRGLLGEYGVAVVGLTIVASLGIVLPVPMTFDLIIVATLLAAGMPVHYAMALLFTLGIFSVYPFTVIWREISRPVAFALAIVLTALGVAGGLAAFGYDRWDRESRGELFLQAFGKDAPPEREAPPVVGLALAELDAARVSLSLEGELLPVAGDLRVERRPFAPRTGGGPLFRKAEGAEYGIDEPYHFDLRRFVRPWSYHRPIAAGDVHNDGWTDIVLPVYEGGVALYANVGGRFVRQRVELPTLDGAFIGQLALVDLDDDGWLDLFVATYRRGNFVIRGEGGAFLEANLTRLPALDVENSLTASSSFGDLDRDGDLDIALGNWARWQKMPEARNALLMRERDGYTVRPLDDPILGETLSMLLTDWNADGSLDLIVGNEGQPSFFYEGDGSGGLSVIERDRGLFPHVPRMAMDLAVADVDNDLVPEIYMGQITGRSTQTEHVDAVSPEALCDQLVDEATRDQCRLDTIDYQVMRRSWGARDTRQCLAIMDPHRRDTCLAYHVLGSAQWTRDPRFCAYLPERWADVANQCHGFFSEKVEYTEGDYARALPQTRNLNMLFMRGADGRFQDRAQEMGVAVAGWTWNGKFADVDNDEWQDLIVANGILEAKTRESNLLFLNREGKGFENATRENGIQDYFPASGYVYVDFDRDGDLDVVVAPVHGPVWIYHNQGASGNSIAFELRDFQGNRFGVGSKVIVHYGEGEARHQVREIQAGGGFISFDPLVAYFGLGEHEAVSRVEVEWSSGGRSEIRGEFRTGGSYTITRPAAVHAGQPAEVGPPS